MLEQLKDDRKPYHEDFRLIMEEMAELANKHFPGFLSLPYEDRTLRDFSNLSLEKKKKALHDSRRYLQIWETLEKEKYDLTDEAQFLWRALKDQGLWLGSDGMKLVKDNEVVELYCLNGTHLWFNLRYMDICSHTMEQVWSLPWTTRYKRNPEAEEACHNEVAKALNSSSPQIRDCQIPKHIVEEIGSTLLFRISLDFQKMAPVYSLQTKDKVGFIVTSKCQVLEAQKELSSIDDSAYTPPETITPLIY